MDSKEVAFTGNEFYHEDGAPKKCRSCGHTEFKERVRDFIDVFEGRGPITEVEYLCGNCNSSVAYWAYGYFDPAYLEYIGEQT